MKIRIKIWLEDKGRPVLGDGRLLLLKAIDETGSIQSAAKKSGVSYRHAWGQVKKLEKRLGVKLLDHTIGGKGGGGSKLTTEAKAFIEKYEAIGKKIHSWVEENFEDLDI
ncbi:MAG TPA: LysR family transcriptional regulator [bacterium]|nr:LysR family transcriptional regulator [bacterium]